MKFHLNQLVLRFKGEIVTLPFTDFNYFYGEMGAGKSSIARLIDYCLGGRLVDTQALQSQFVWASLNVTVEATKVTLTRDYHSERVRASWEVDGSITEIMLPARKAEGEVLPGTGIETLSDLIFNLAKITPPRVRRGQYSESDLVRLSLRDLLWYCYLDQDDIDSSFFKLEREGNPVIRLKSISVLRYILGYYHEQVTELELKLETLRRERFDAIAGYDAIKKVLTEEELPSELDLAARRRTLEDQENQRRRQAEEIRAGISNLRTHAADEVRLRAQALDIEVSDLQNALNELELQIERDKAHRNELLNLGTKFRRAQSARAVLGGVAFRDCPRCAQVLPVRTQEQCIVCGQLEPTPEELLDAEKIAETDLG